MTLDDTLEATAAAGGRVKRFARHVWEVIVGIALFLPRLLHDLVVRPSEDVGAGTRHMLVWEFGQAYKNLPYLLWSLAFKTRTLEEQMQEASLRSNLRRTFGRFTLINIGLGYVTGQSVWYLNGFLMAKGGGSSVFIGYLIEFVFVFLAALIFSELTIEHPVAGGPFTWTLATLGEFPAAMCLGMLIVQYTLGNAVYGGALTPARIVAIPRPTHSGAPTLPTQVYSREVSRSSSAPKDRWEG